MRLASIDILRALTMVLMIWVNDFWSLIDIPKWLTHASATEDYMGFSDVIFPLFLFIVGLSIPLAVQHRFDKKDSSAIIAKHILIRSLSLLVIGLYMVNYETAHENMIVSKSVWSLLMAIAVVLIWTNWKRSPVDQKWHLYLQAAGYLILVFLAFIYKGGENGELWMTTQWWGILGLIGWAYLLNALVYLYAKGNLWIMALLWIVLNGLAVLTHSAFAPKLDGLLVYLSPILTGAIPAFTTAGIVATLLFKKLRHKDLKWFYATLFGLGLIYSVRTGHKTHLGDFKNSGNTFLVSHMYRYRIYIICCFILCRGSKKDHELGQNYCTRRYRNTYLLYDSLFNLPYAQS